MKPVDVVVIGGGILGACASYYLAAAGYKTVVLEQGDAASGASGANLGQISIVDRHQSWHLQLARETLAMYQDIMEEEDIQYCQSGGSVALIDQDQVDAAWEYKKILEAQGVPVEIADDERISEWEPFFQRSSALAVAYCPLEGKLNPLYTTLYFHKKAKLLGVELYTHSPVIALDTEEGKITAVRCPDRVFHPRWVVNAAGSWAAAVGSLAGAEIPIRFHRGTALVTESLPAYIRGPMVGGGFLLPAGAGREKRHIAFGVTQSGEGSLIIGQATEESSLGSRDITLPGLALMAARFLRHFPSLKSIDVLRVWAAVTPYTDDGLPVYGFSQAVQNLFTVAGFKGAFTTAPAVGKRLPGDLAGAPLDAEWRSFSPDRIKEKSYGCN
jgi:sarcosine oxidase subunit beta